jgi:hypothetical protein
MPNSDGKAMSGVALVLSIIAIVVSGWQAWEARQARKEQARAWVNVTEVAPLPNVQGRKLTVRVKFANEGHSPAHDTAVVYQVEVTNDFSPPGEPPENSYKNPVVIAAGAHSHLDISLADELTPTQIEQWKSGQTLYLSGVFRYLDVYNQRHFTRFCFSYDQKTNVFSSCSSYNSAD